MDALLVALYETKRQNFLTAFVQNPEHFDSALAFAYEKRLAPVFHENVLRETYESDPFAGVYAVKADFANEVINYINDRWHSEDFESLEFYKLEDKFGGYKRNRTELIYIVEYARISGRFDDRVYAAIERNAPVEANSLRAKFSPNDVYFH